MATTQISKSTPVLIVEAIEPSLPFWQERLGFLRPVEVPDGDFDALTKTVVPLIAHLHPRFHYSEIEFTPERISEVLSLPDDRRAELREAARRACVERWSWSSVARRILAASTPE